VAWTLEQSKEAATRSKRSISTDVVASSRWLERENELKTIRRFKNDWDGMGAAAPNPHVIDNAIRFLRKLKQTEDAPAPDSITASPTGSVVLIWNSNDEYVEAEIAVEWIIEWMRETPSGTSHTSIRWNDMDREVDREYEGRGVLWEDQYSTLAEPAAAVIG
jgi:hypothetical protein